MLVDALSGALAGTTVDALLFPLDTIKTRLQSFKFIQSGGFRNIYSGFSIAFLASAPSAALFFTAYQQIRSDSFILAATVGEIAACVVRVPTDNIKQRMQIGQQKLILPLVKIMYRDLGFWGFYKGYGMTIFREIPFAAIQFTLYESLKKRFANPTSFELGACGFLAGGIAAAATTPLDVIKTRVMLSSKVLLRLIQMGRHSSIPHVVKYIIAQRGYGGFLTGIGPRMLWISIGGSIFLGSFEFYTKMFHHL
jgi:solute carrier family 25 S-adenosylmethionine transporter 26